MVATIFLLFLLKTQTADTQLNLIEVALVSTHILGYTGITSFFLFVYCIHNLCFAQNIDCEYS